MGGVGGMREGSGGGAAPPSVGGAGGGGGGGGEGGDGDDDDDGGEVEGAPSLLTCPAPAPEDELVLIPPPSLFFPPPSPTSFSVLVLTSFPPATPASPWPCCFWNSGPGSTAFPCLPLACIVAPTVTLVPHTAGRGCTRILCVWMPWRAAELTGMISLLVGVNKVVG